MSITISYPSTQFEELYGPFVNLGVHLPPKDNSPQKKCAGKYIQCIQRSQKAKKPCDGTKNSNGALPKAKPIHKVQHRHF